VFPASQCWLSAKKTKSRSLVRTDGSFHLKEKLIPSINENGWQDGRRIGQIEESQLFVNGVVGYQK